MVSDKFAFVHHARGLLVAVAARETACVVFTLRFCLLLYGGYLYAPRCYGKCCGHGAQWWKEFFSVVRMCGYDGDVSLEMEDLTLPMLEGHISSLRTLKEALML